MRGSFDRPVTGFVVPDVVRLDAIGDQVELALMPNPLPSVKQVTWDLSDRHFWHSTRFSRSRAWASTSAGDG
jgi:hypothetical protein